MSDDRADERTDHQREQDRAITLALYAAQWHLEAVAHKLPADLVTVEGWNELLTALDSLRELVRMRCGDNSGDHRGNASGPSTGETG